MNSNNYILLSRTLFLNSNESFNLSQNMLDGHHCNIRGPLNEFVHRITLFYNNI